MADQHPVRQPAEQAGGQEAGNAAQNRICQPRILDRPEFQIDDPIAPVGDEGLALDLAQSHAFVCDVIIKALEFGANRVKRGTRIEGRDLHRQRERAQPVDLLAHIRNDNDLQCRLGDNLLAQQGPAPALDEHKIPIELVRTVDGKMQPGRPRGIHDRDLRFSGQSLDALRTRHAHDIGDPLAGHGTERGEKHLGRTAASKTESEWLGGE